MMAHPPPLHEGPLGHNKDDDCSRKPEDDGAEEIKLEDVWIRLNDGGSN